MANLFLLDSEKHRPPRMEPRASGDERKADRLGVSVKKATLFEILQGASSGLLANESRDVAKRP